MSAQCPFKDKRYHLELLKMYTMDLLDSRWTIEEVNQYYLQKVYIDFPTVGKIREYLMNRTPGIRRNNKFRGQIIEHNAIPRADKVSKSRDGSLGDFLTLFTKLIDKETAEINKKKEEELRTQKMFPSISNPEELSLAKAVSGSFKVSEPSDTRKAQPSNKPSKIYKETDFLTEEGYRNYLINDDLSQLVPENFRGNNQGMRGYPGIVYMNNQGISKKEIDEIMNIQQNEDNTKISEYKETSKDVRTHEAEESMKQLIEKEEGINTSTKNHPTSKEPVAVNLKSSKTKQESKSPFTQQIERELERLTKLLDSQEQQLKDIDDEMVNLNFDEPDYDEQISELENKKKVIYGEYQQTLNKYNVLVSKFR